MVKKNNDYFNMLTELVQYSCNAAKLLNDILQDFKNINIEDKIKEMHEIEHIADIKKHEMLSKLEKEFITPIDRGDIIELSHQLDNVTDSIEEVLVSMYMYNLTYMRDDIIEFSRLIVKIVTVLKDLVCEFKNFKKSNKITGLLDSINSLEEEGDQLFIIGTKRLFTQERDAIELLKWKDILLDCESCCDKCEHAADVIKSVMMKNL